MIRKVILMPDPILKEVALPVSPIDVMADIDEICQDLIDTVKARHGEHGIIGVGLAAPQIGVRKRIVVINYDKHKDLVMINPVIKAASGRMKHDEMCLSYPGFFKRKTRKQYVEVEYLDQNLNPKHQVFTALSAFIVQHELDHLDGITLND